jgi:hypothetical protein
MCRRCSKKQLGKKRPSAQATTLENAMNGYFLQFQIVGEVADMLLLDGADRRLLVDVSVDPPIEGEVHLRRYPNRATLTIRDEDVIRQFLSDVSVGDVAEASGSFSQSDYIPHRTTCIDTTFLVTRFRKLEAPEDMTMMIPQGTMPTNAKVTLH